MEKKLLHAYKIQILISITLFIVLLALKVERDPIQIALYFLGTFLGTFALDLDYFLYAYFMEPEKEFSKHIKGYTKHQDILGAMTYIHYHKSEIKDKTLNSALFQVALAGLMIFVVGSSTNFMFKALVLSVFVNSIYRMAEEFFENRTDLWFWAFKSKPDKNTFIVYSCGLIIVLLFSLGLV